MAKEVEHNAPVFESSLDLGPGGAPWEDSTVGDACGELGWPLFGDDGHDINKINVIINGLIKDILIV